MNIKEKLMAIANKSKDVEEPINPTKPSRIREYAKQPSEPLPKLEPNHERDDCLRLMQKTLAEYKLESNIPVHHEYWDACNKFRGLSRHDEA